MEQETRFDPAEARSILARTPATLRTWLDGLPGAWVRADEGEGTWSPFDVVGHLIHGELTDWMPRLRIILEHGGERPFESFDRLAQFEASRGKTLSELLERFSELRARNLEALGALRLEATQFALRGRHPELGPVTLGELLATWVVHDLGHVAQIARAMAKRYADDVGPWAAFLPVLGR